MKTRGISVLGLTVLLLASAGCHRESWPSAARSDHQIIGDVEAKLNAESALSGEKIQVAVNNGVVTLTGVATDPASRALAGNDAGSVIGVRTVVNNLEVQPPQTAAALPRSSEPQQPLRERRHSAAQNVPPSEPSAQRSSAAAEQPAEAAVAQPPSNAAPDAAPQPEPAPVAAAAPAPPAQPVEKTVVLDTGTVIPIRIVEALDSATSQPDQGFHATLASDLISGDMIAAPQGTPVLGRIVDARDAAHFKGNALLAIELTRIDLQGSHIAVVTDTYSKQGAARGKDTAQKIGGGTILGSVIGALAGGGKGAAIGAIAGAGAGTGVNAATRGQQVQISSETLISFKLVSPITVVTSRAVGSPPPANEPSGEPVLHQHSQ